MDNTTAPYTLVTLVVLGAEGNVKESGWLLDPRERSARVAKEDIASAWARLPPARQNLTELISQLVKGFGFMRAAKAISIEVEAGVRADDAQPARAPDLGWNWR